jgi:hypothetical protein
MSRVAGGVVGPIRRRNGWEASVALLLVDKESKWKKRSREEGGRGEESDNESERARGGRVR